MINFNPNRRWLLPLGIFLEHNKRSSIRDLAYTRLRKKLLDDYKVETLGAAIADGMFTRPDDDSQPTVSFKAMLKNYKLRSVRGMYIDRKIRIENIIEDDDVPLTREEIDYWLKPESWAVENIKALEANVPKAVDVVDSITGILTKRQKNALLDERPEPKLSKRTISDMLKGVVDFDNIRTPSVIQITTTVFELGNVVPQVILVTSARSDKRWLQAVLTTVEKFKGNLLALSSQNMNSSFEDAIAEQNALKSSKGFLCPLAPERTLIVITNRKVLDKLVSI